MPEPYLQLGKILSDILFAGFWLKTPVLIRRLFPYVTSKFDFRNMKEHGNEIQGFRINVIKVTYGFFYLFFSVLFYNKLYFLKVAVIQNTLNN